MTAVQQVIIPYKPRPQFLPVHNRTQRWAAIVAHRRLGKTVGEVNDLIKGALTCEHPDPRFAYIAPTYSQAKDVAWEYLKKYGLAVPGAVPHETELRVDFPNGGRVRLYGSDNFDRIRGVYLDGVVFDEYGDQDPRAWTEVVRPALSDRKGWATFIGTPKGDNHFRELWDMARENPEWYTLMLKASQTGILDDQELASARSMMTAEQYAAEYECSFEGSVVGSYYGAELAKLQEQGAIGDFGWLPDHAVHTIWDTGGTTAVWFVQTVGTNIRVIDYLEGVNKNAAYYAGELRARPYSYGTHIAPSDADEEKEIVGKSWKTSFEELEIFGWQILPKQKGQLMTESTRRSYSCRDASLIPLAPATLKTGLRPCKNYRREWDDKRKKFRDEPRHDWASHPSDAFRYLAVGLPLISDARGQGAGSDWSKPLKYQTKWIT
jgi:phage terminase large subunit